MARIVRRIEIAREATDVFDAIADFSMTATWDPGVGAARPLDTPPVGPGARFDLTLAMGPLHPHLQYTTETYDRPRRVVLRARNRLIDGTDEVTVEDAGAARCVVTWKADVDLRGAASMLDPLLARGFERVGDKAVAGLQEWLAGGGTAAHPPD